MLRISVHDFARIQKKREDPKEVHAQEVEYIVPYLKSTRNKCIVLKLNKEKSPEVYADIDFVGNWYKATADFDASTAKSRTGFLIYIPVAP